MKFLVENYLYSSSTSVVNNEELFKKCLVIEKIINQVIPKRPGSDDKITNKHYDYNLFTFPVKELNDLYFEMQKQIYPLLDVNTNYALKAWLNVYHRGQSLPWHSHWRSECKAWHGFYCVSVGNNESATIYKIPSIEEEVVVNSSNGLLVIGKSENDLHKTTEWTKDTPRVTIAFDIVPLQAVNVNEATNMNGLALFHFIPFK